MTGKPTEGVARDRVVNSRLSPDDSKTFDRRRQERGGLSPSAYIRTLVREDGKKEKPAGG